MQKIFQLWGLEPIKENEKQTLLERLQTALQNGAKVIIAGQTNDAAFHRDICTRAHQAGAQAFLWAPLFSEYNDAFAYQAHIGANGAPLPKSFGENFYFRCPQSVQNLNAFFAQQDGAMRAAPFDGIFLDRVRYPSFAHGSLRTMGCFCPDCKAKYRQAGINVEALVHALVHKKHPNPLALCGFDGSDYHSADENMALFLALRAKNITHAVERIKNHYALFGQSVALDLFPPSLAYLVGQSLHQLLPLCAFVKPMLYRITHAPAGLPFERKAYAQKVGTLQTLDALLGARNETARIQAEVLAYEQVKKQSGLSTPIAWGIEICSLPPIVRADAHTVKSTLSLIQSAGGKAICAAWSLISAQEKCLHEFIHFG